MLLKNKNAVIYGAGGSLGGAVAKALAAAGAKVFLTGRSLTSVQIIADEILANGGDAEVAQVDGFNEVEIYAHLNKLVGGGITIDISFNAVDIAVTQGKPLVEMTTAEFVDPVTATLQTRFLTARAAAQVMMKQKSGVILTLTATPGGIGYPNTGGFAVACSAVERLSANMAGELGIYGIRVVNIRSGGSPDSKVFADAIKNNSQLMAGVLKSMEADTMLKQLPQMAEIASVAVFLASDMAAKITGVTIDVTGGTTAGLNYRVPPLAG